jgi:hypothetical protein
MRQAILLLSSLVSVLGLCDSLAGQNTSDIQMRSLSWSTTSDEIVCRYSLFGGNWPQLLSIRLFWATGSRVEDRLSDASAAMKYILPQSTNGTSKILTLKFDSSILEAAPPEATTLLAIADAEQYLPEVSEINNVAALSLPTIIISPNSAIKPDIRGRCWIEPTLPLKMPSLTMEVINLPTRLGANPSITWHIRAYLESNASPGGKEVSLGVFSETAGSVYTPKVDVITGGNVQIAAEFNLGSSKLRASHLNSPAVADLQILGRNPTRSQVFTYIDSLPVPASWPTNSIYNYHRVLKQISLQESLRGPYQFNEKADFAGHPLWNSNGDGGGDGGVGIMQVTTSPIVHSNVWDWTQNVKAGASIFNTKLAAARSYARTTEARTEFKRAVNSLNQWRVSQNLPSLTVRTPPLTANERVLFAIRYYNGASGRDSIGRPFRHEFEPMLGPTNLLDVTVMPNSTTATSKWRQVSPNDRTVPEKDYVRKVLDQKF